METLVRDLKFITSNRSINRTHVDKIKESIKKHGFLPDKAILVNDKLQILDGQHRYQACIELGVEPVYKIVKNADCDLMIDLNSTQSSWAIKDYIHYFASSGLESYQLLSSFVERNNINCTVALALINSQDGKAFKSIRQGDFKVDEDTITNAQQILDLARVISEEYRIPINRYLCASLRNLNHIEGFQWNVLLKQMAHYRDKVYQCSKTTSYIDMFKVVYNFRKSSGRI